MKLLEPDLVEIQKSSVFIKVMECIYQVLNIFVCLFLLTDCHFAYSYKTDTKGMFASPGFPSEYPDSVTCSYFFHASASGRVQITFDFFSLEKPSDKG